MPARLPNGGRRCCPAARGSSTRVTTARTASTMRTSWCSRCLSGARKVLVRGAYDGRYFPSGHLIYVRDATLFAAPFDLDATGGDRPAGPRARRPHRQPARRRGQFAVSNTARWSICRDRASRYDAPIDWVDRSGKSRRCEPRRPTGWHPPSRPMVAGSRWPSIDGKQYGIWVYDWGRDALSRLTLRFGR